MYNNNVTTFDTDSKIIGVDNRCSACISHVKREFITSLKDTHVTITDFGGNSYKGIKNSNNQMGYHK